MTASSPRQRRLTTLAATGFSLIAAAALVAGTPASLAATSGQAGRALPAAPALGQIGAYGLGQLRVVLTELAHTGPTGTYLGARSLPVTVLYPVLTPASTVRKFPLVVFAPGYLQCPAPYLPLLKAIASAGYVVASVTFPRTGCTSLAHRYEPDLVNEPQDLSFMITALLNASAASTGPLSGLINAKEIGAAGHSDGGDVVALLAANSCCTDKRVTATAVFSGSEWFPPPGRYFAVKPAAMLFVQGNKDTINPPFYSRQLYNLDPSRNRYYLDQLGANHTLPYWGTNSVELRTALITTDFFDLWLLHQPTGPAMRASGNVPGKAIFRSGASAAPLT